MSLQQPVDRTLMVKNRFVRKRDVSLSVVSDFS